MKTRYPSPISSLCALILGVFLAHNCAADQVLNWNRVASDVFLANTTLQNPGIASRSMAMVNLAMYDSINGIAPANQQFYVHPAGPVGGDTQAAAAQAARDVLTSIYPGQQTMIDAELSTVLNAIPNSTAKTAGVAYGSQVATNVINARMGDGYNNMVSYMPTGNIGNWESDPSLPSSSPTQVAWGPQWGQVSTFATNNSSQFMPGPMPALTSQDYADAYNEVKDLGAVNSTTRTADQTEAAIFWAYDRVGMGTPMRMYNKIMRDVATAQGNTLHDNAHMFTLASVSVADAGITAWDAKFTYDFWRPVSGIRKGDMDGNPNTIVDPNWTPLGAPGDAMTPDFTPPFPTYISGHATFGAAAFKSLENFFGTDAISFSVTSEEQDLAPGTVRSFSSFSDAMEENGRSRVYLGIHWDFDDLASHDVGGNVADFVNDNFFAVVPEPSGLFLWAMGMLLVIRRRR